MAEQSRLEKLVAEYPQLNNSAANPAPATDTPVATEEVPALTTEAPKTDDAPSPTTDIIATSPAAEAEVDDAKMLAYYNKKFGTNHASLEEFNKPKVITEEESRINAEKERGEAIEFGKSNLYNKPFTQSEYDEFIKFSGRDKFSVVRDSEIASLKALYPSMTTEEIESTVDDHFHANADPESHLYKLGQKRIADAYEAMKAEKYDHILKVEGVHKQYKEAKQKADQASTQYLASIETVVKDLPKTFDYKIDKVTVPFKIDYNDEKIKEAVEEIKKSVLNHTMLGHFRGQDGRTDNQRLKEYFNNALKLRMNEISHEAVARSYAAQVQLETHAGQRGVPLPSMSLVPPEPSTILPKSPRTMALAKEQGKAV